MVKDNGKGGAPLGSTALLLSDLASQHERLGELFTDLRTALSTAQATARKANRLFSHGIADGAVGTDSETDAFSPQRSLPEVIRVGDPPLDPEQEPPGYFEAHAQHLTELVGDRDPPADPEAMEEQLASPSDFRQRVVEATSAESSAFPRRCTPHCNDGAMPSGVKSGSHLTAWELLQESNERHRHALDAPHHRSSHYSHHSDRHLHHEAPAERLVTGNHLTASELLDTNDRRRTHHHHHAAHHPAPEGVTSGEHPSAWELLEDSDRRRTVRSSSRSSLRSKPFSDYENVDADSNSDGGDVTGTGTGSMPARVTRIRSSSQVWKQEMSVIRQNAVFRLQARLGKHHVHGRVTPADVYRAVTSLGLVKFSLGDIERWLWELAHVGEHQSSLLKRSSSFWRAVKKLGPGRSKQLQEAKDGNDEEGKSLEFKELVETLLDDEQLTCLEQPYQQMSLTIREVLFSGDANRLVAELTHVRVDDVAAPMDKPDFMTFMEPVVGFIILLNGLFIGLQTSQEDQVRGDAWFWGNAAFTIFFVCEISMRTWSTGAIRFFTGGDRWWNIFDSILIAMSVFDLLMETFQANADVAQLAVMRIMRLTRLARLIRIFRLRYMKELTLMVRGLLGGLYTLFWAVVLLFFTLYVIAILATTTIGRGDNPVPEIVKDELFASLPKAIFTSFRCFMGDCNTTEGKPIIKLLSDRYGLPFIMGYLISMMFVTFGLFNLIIAIYIENTLNAAKTEGEKNRIQRQRESVRVARLTRQLLKKFCAVQRLWGESHGGESREVKKILNAAIFDDLGEISMPVSKEMFLCIIQDASVQKLMDELDIPAERASLFDILDADGSGGLEVVELITGLLRVRGEAKKSDIVGCLLAVRVVQDMLRDHGDRVAELEFQLERLQRSFGIRISHARCRGSIGGARTSMLIEDPLQHHFPQGWTPAAGGVTHGRRSHAMV